MMKLHRPLCPDLTFRLTHDISPDNLPDEKDDTESELLKEQFIFNCLAQAKQRQDSFSDRLKDKTKHEIERTTSEKLSPFELKQRTLEQLNNVINVQYHGKQENKTIDLNIYNNVNTESKYSQEEKPEIAPTKTSHSTTTTSNANTGNRSNTPSRQSEHQKPRRPRKLPEIPKKHTLSHSSSKTDIVNEKCLLEELQEALTQEVIEDDDNVFLPNPPCQIKPQAGKSNKVYPKFSGKFLEELKHLQFNAVSKNTRAYLNSDNIYLEEDSSIDSRRHLAIPSVSGNGRRDSSDEEGSSKRKSSSSFPATSFQDLEVTHRGMHRFIPRHKDEIAIEIGDPLHVFKLADDLWCEGLNLRTSKQGIFPSMYATDLEFLEDTEPDQDGVCRFNLRFLGSVEVNYHKGDDVLVQAINKVALTRTSTKCSTAPPICNVEISQYGIRMLDKSKTGHESDQFTHFFALKNISFCGNHPRNERYFAFITKHPKEYRFACHVFLGERSTRTVSEALGNAFKRFYQEYMAFTHQTEDIYIE